MSELAGLEAAAVPAVEAAVKALTPEAEALVTAAEAHLKAEAERLKAEIDNSHNSVIVWLRDHLASQTPAATTASAADPTPAAPAPQS
jgi:hypothetical protein